MTASIRARRQVFALDCPDSLALAKFYARLLGWRAEPSEDSDWVKVLPPEGEPGAFEIACQQVEGYRAPTWPEGPVPQQAHLDFYVDSIAEAAPIAVAAGASVHPQQPGEQRGWKVFLDPAGHPFCFCEE